MKTKADLEPVINRARDIYEHALREVEKAAKDFSADDRCALTQLAWLTRADTPLAWQALAVAEAPAAPTPKAPRTKTKTARTAAPRRRRP